MKAFPDSLIGSKNWDRALLGLYFGFCYEWLTLFCLGMEGLCPSEILKGSS